jgi:hypothetical protein
MKTALHRTLTLCAPALLALSVTLHAGEPPKPKPTSPEFGRMKSLVGTWKGMTDMGQGPVEMVSQYRLIAGGTALEEKVFAGTPDEMTTMYYDRDGKLALTHYCVLGNRPGMVLDSADAKTLRFAFDKTCGINPKTESHMHALTLTFVDADTITASCKAFMDGKEMPEHPTTMKRVKP